MKHWTIEKVESDLAKHEAARRRGTAGPYTDFELHISRNGDHGTAGYVRDRRAFNTALRNARRSIARAGQ